MENKGRKLRYHFIAIGGIGMSGLAQYLLENGHEVSGSDIVDSKYLDKLKKSGAKIFIGHNANNVPDNCIVVASSAIKEDNVEIQRAKELNLKIYHRSDMLAEISRNDKLFLGFAGTHGKTTTSGLASYVLEKAGLKPSYVVGGIIPELHNNSHCQNGEMFCAELDESDGTIVKYKSDITVINNLEPDHLDFYKNGLPDLIKTFETFLSGLKPNSVVLINNDNDGNNYLLKNQVLDSLKCYTYGLNKADYVAKNINFDEEFTSFDVYYKNDFLTNLKIYLKGVHNVYNSLAVLASLHQADVDIELVKPHFMTFTGMGRRFEKKGESNGIVFYDDYAHHPTEIKATLSCAKCFKNKNVIAVFQPHRYTRLKSLWNEFKNSFDGVDRVIVTDVYAASEQPIDNVNSETFAKETGFEYIQGSISDVAQKMAGTLKSGDVVISLGAGTITDLSKKLLEKLTVEK